MTSTVTGPRRIKGQLPAGTVVVYKTGSSRTNNGVAAATNDAGIVTLPNGKQYIIVIFDSDSPDDENTREEIIASIARVARDAYSIR